MNDHAQAAMPSQVPASRQHVDRHLQLNERMDHQISRVAQMLARIEGDTPKATNDNPVGQIQPHSLMSAMSSVNEQQDLYLDKLINLLDQLEQHI